MSPLIDTIVPGTLGAIRDSAAAAGAVGFDGIWVAETASDPFPALALAAETAPGSTLGTALAIAFARTPMVMAYPAWEQHNFSGGRFILGLGSQVKAHIESRFSMPWSEPAKRMREYVAALRAIWASWADGTRLDFRGDYYTHTLMTPMFAPPPCAHGAPPVFVAAVGPAMTRVAAEVADGLIVHPFTSSRYLDEVLLPLVDEGLAASGRTRAQFQVMVMPIVACGTSAETFAAARLGTRKQLAFYASTPAYRAVLDLHGWSDVQPELRRLSKEGRWDDMAQLIDDSMLDTYAIVTTPGTMARDLLRRYGKTADRVGANLRFCDVLIDRDRMAELRVGGMAAPSGHRALRARAGRGTFG